MRVLIVVPTYQEADNVVPFLEAVRSALPAAHILIVDDNSPDGTGQLADATAARLGQIEVLHRERKQGLGSAYRAGFAHALASDATVIVQMDVDFSHDPAVLPQMVAAVSGDDFDAAIGARYVRGGSTVNWPIHRRILSRWGNRYTALVLGLPLHDITSGYRSYRRDALVAIEPATTDAEGYAFLTELARRLIRRGLRVGEVPIRFADRVEGTSKMSGSIIRESMVLVTRWGVSDLVHGRRRRGQR